MTAGAFETSTRDPRYAREAVMRRSVLCALTAPARRRRNGSRRVQGADRLVGPSLNFPGRQCPTDRN